jgi:hypothetical protein
MDHDAFDARLTGSVLQPFKVDTTRLAAVALPWPGDPS